jgi:hypothetical protein
VTVGMYVLQVKTHTAGTLQETQHQGRFASL